MENNTNMTALHDEKQVENDRKEGNQQENEKTQHNDEKRTSLLLRTHFRWSEKKGSPTEQMKHMQRNWEKKRSAIQLLVRSFWRLLSHSSASVFRKTNSVFFSLFCFLLSAECNQVCIACILWIFVSNKRITLENLDRKNSREFICPSFSCLIEIDLLLFSSGWCEGLFAKRSCKNQTTLSCCNSI